MKKYFRQRSRVCDVCVANMGEGFGKARTAYTLLNDVCFSFYFLKENHFSTRPISFFNVGGAQEGVRG